MIRPNPDDSVLDDPHETMTRASAASVAMTIPLGQLPPTATRPPIPDPRHPIWIPRRYSREVDYVGSIRSAGTGGSDPYEPHMTPQSHQLKDCLATPGDQRSQTQVATPARMRSCPRCCETRQIVWPNRQHKRQRPIQLPRDDARGRTDDADVAPVDPYRLINHRAAPTTPQDLPTSTQRTQAPESIDPQRPLAP